MNVYFGTTGKDADGIYHSQFDPDSGELTEPRRVAEARKAGFLALHPESPILYAATETSEGAEVTAYGIEAGGDVSKLNSVPINDGGAAHLAVHPSGEFLITAQYGAGSVALFPLEADGRVGERSQLIRHEGGSGVNERRQAAPHPHWTGFSPDGRYAFVPDLGKDTIEIYRVDLDSGKLDPAGSAEANPGSGPRHMRFSADGRFIYLLNELDCSITTFAFDPSTAETNRLATTPALTDEQKAASEVHSGSEVVVHPNGRFVYSGNRGHDSITVYATDTETGSLTPAQVESIRGEWPRNFNLDPSGKWLLAGGQRSNTVTVFSVSPETGKLEFTGQSAREVPNVSCILFAAEEKE